MADTEYANKLQAAGREADVQARACAMFLLEGKTGLALISAAKFDTARAAEAALISDYYART